MDSFLNISVIIVALVLIIVVLAQVRGAGAGLFGGGDNSYRTRRGIERTLFQFTLILGVLFVLLSISGLVIDRLQQ